MIRCVGATFEFLQLDPMVRFLAVVPASIPSVKYFWFSASSRLIGVKPRASFPVKNNVLADPPMNLSMFEAA
jgi:hypothetical protein